MMKTLEKIESVKNPIMTLITKEEMKRLVKAGYDGFKPIVKLFGGPVTWLVTGIEDGVLYGFGDLGMDCVEWGSLTHVDELPTMRAGIGYLERDRFFKHKEGTVYLDLNTLVGI